METPLNVPRPFGQTWASLITAMLLTASLLLAGCGPQASDDGNQGDSGNTSNNTDNNNSNDQWDTLTWDEGDWS